MRWTRIPIRTSFIIQSAITSAFPLSGTMIWWLTVLQVRLSFHQGHIEQDFSKLRKMSSLKESAATEPEALVNSICQRSHFFCFFRLKTKSIHFLLNLFFCVTLELNELLPLDELYLSDIRASAVQMYKFSCSDPFSNWNRSSNLHVTWKLASAEKVPSMAILGRVTPLLDVTKSSDLQFLPSPWL